MAGDFGRQPSLVTKAFECFGVYRFRPRLWAERWDVYHKFDGTSWFTFVENANNAIHSAPGYLGFCPIAESSEWTQGLTAGHTCVQLTLEDGGPNDADGIRNGVIVDPGVVSVRIDKPIIVPEPVTPPEQPPVMSMKGKSGGAIALSDLFVLWLMAAMMVGRRAKRFRQLAVINRHD